MIKTFVVGLDLDEAIKAEIDLPGPIQEVPILLKSAISFQMKELQQIIDSQIEPNDRCCIVFHTDYSISFFLACLVAAVTHSSQCIPFLISASGGWSMVEQAYVYTLRDTYIP